MNHIFLYGPPGIGKSTIGKILSRNLKHPFVDLDHIIEAKAGMSIPEIMEAQGELMFRDLETEALKSLATEKESVIALGGGALLRAENRAFAEDQGKVVLLMSDVETLFQRLNEGSNNRPLLAGDMRAKLTSLLEKRSEHYASFPLNVHVNGNPIEYNAHKVQVVLGRHHLSAMGEYDAVVGHVEQIGELLRTRGLQNPMLVADENMAKLHVEKVIAALRKSGYEPKVITLPPGEQHKNLENVLTLWKSFLAQRLDRDSTVIALGGGVISDLSGFAAATYMRGIAWVGIPTTLLSMADASLGGKTGFDLPEGKNLIGSFYPPKLVLADPSLLLTLPNAELISGMAEVVKHGVIADPELFELCTRGLDWVKDNLEEVVKRAVAVKIKVIEEDPYEKGIRAKLNLGHTVGHAVELVSQFKLRHGEAVAIGTVVEAKYAERIGIAEKGLADKIGSTMSALGLPISIPLEMPREEIISIMKVDKKKTATAIRFALPVEIGRVDLVEVINLEDVLE